MDMRIYSAKNYIKLGDLADGPLIKTIVGVEEGKFDKPDIEFDDGSRLGLNKTSVRALAKVLGWDSDDWIGQRVEIYAGVATDQQGNTKPAVYVRPIGAPAKKKPAADFNDSIDF